LNSIKDLHFENKKSDVWSFSLVKIKILKCLN
jgi:hypothetical protein